MMALPESSDISMAKSGHADWEGCLAIVLFLQVREQSFMFVGSVSSVTFSRFYFPLISFSQQP